MAKYRKKPVVVEAIQFKGPDINGVTQMVEFDDWMVANQGDICCLYRGDKVLIPTLEGSMEASPGDWIIRGVKGEIYACKDDVFRLTYEAVE